MGPAVEHKHELVVPIDAWYMRVYQSLWGGDPHKADFCKLFWAFFPPFLIVAILLRAILLPLAAIVTAADRYKASRAPKEPKVVKVKEPKVPREPSVRMQAVLMRLEIAAVKTIMAVQKLGRALAAIIKLVMLNRLALWTMRGVVYVGGGLLALGCTLALVYETITHFTIVITWTGVLAACAAMIAVAIFLIALSYMPIFNYLLKPTGQGLKTGGLTFAQVLRLGYVAVKSNTCPRITVK